MFLYYFDNIFKFRIFHTYELLIFRIGSTLFLVGIYFICRYLYYIGKQLKRGHSSLRNGHKFIIAILLIAILIFVYANQTSIIPKIKNVTSKFSAADFNPTNIHLGSENQKVELGSQLISSSLTNFLPQPWGFVVFWGIVILVVLLLIRHYIFKDDFPDWLTWALIIIGIVLIFQYHIPYATVSINDFNLECKNGNVVVKNNLMGLGTWASQMSASLSCADYKSSRCRPLCQNNQPVCQCEANSIDLVFHQKGDWILGGWG
jgi:hypothetical protein